MAISAVLFALMNFCVRLASDRVPWTTLGASRAFVGALVAIGVARYRGAALVVRDKRGVWLRSLFGTCAMGLTFYALANPSLPLADTATLLNLAPVFLAVLTPFFLREALGRRVFAALAVSVTGVVLVLHPTLLFGGAPPGDNAFSVALVAVSAAFCAACAMITLRRMGPGENPEAIALHFSLAATAALLLLGVRDLTLPSLHDATLMLLAGLCAGLAQLSMTRAYALERAARVGSMGYLSVVVSALLGALALHEWPTTQSVLGMGLVIAGGLVIAIAGLRDGRANETQSRRAP
jgi:drug/metabolite transporter (DMT)-like permease